MKPIWKRVVFVAVFVVSFGAFSLLNVLLMTVGWSDPPVHPFRGRLASIGAAVLNLIWFPVRVVHETFFAGGPLPGNDWLWILGCGLLYAVVGLVVFDCFTRLRAKRAKSRLDTRA